MSSRDVPVPIPSVIVQIHVERPTVRTVVRVATTNGIAPRIPSALPYSGSRGCAEPPYNLLILFEGFKGEESPSFPLRGQFTLS